MKDYYGPDYSYYGPQFYGYYGGVWGPAYYGHYHHVWDSHGFVGHRGYSGFHARGGFHMEEPVGASRAEVVPVLRVADMGAGTARPMRSERKQRRLKDILCFWQGDSGYECVTRSDALHDHLGCGGSTASIFARSYSRHAI